MYVYTEFDRQFVRERAAQYRDQLERNLAGTLSDDAFRPLRLQNGWYVQRYAPMLRVAVPYGELASRQMRVLARIAREFDQPDPDLLARAQATQDGIDERAGSAPGPRLQAGYGHFTTRQNVQFNWIPLHKSADVMELLATVDMHGIQTSGNCIRNVTSDAFAGIAPDEVADPRPWAEILRQWSTLQPEFAFLPRKFKVAITGAAEDRAAIGWHDVGLKLVRQPNAAAPQGPNGPVAALAGLGFEVRVGGGMGRTPVVASVLSTFVPWQHILNYLEAIVRVYNRWGRRDNMYKARIKILVKAEGERFTDEVAAEFNAILEHDGAQHTLPVAEYLRVAAGFVEPTNWIASTTTHEAPSFDAPGYARWVSQNVRAHRHPGLRAVTLSFKRPGQAPGDATADQLDAVADLAERFSAAEMRVTHQQNVVLPWVKAAELPALWEAAKALGLAQPNLGLLTDMIACPGGDYCALANARSIPVASAITERYADLDEALDLGPIDLHISGCINSCGHHHSGHIGILGVDKDGQEWYQITLGGSDGADLGGSATPGKVVGPSFAADEVVHALEAILSTYQQQRQGQEAFIQTLRRVGHDPFKLAANATRQRTARTSEAVAA